jgi:tripartite-type tricarboxylate transporter receptor subunit TctC
MKSISYSGGSAILTSLLGGHVDLAITARSSAVPNPQLRVVMILTKPKTYRPIPKVETAGTAAYDVDAPLLRAGRPAAPAAGDATVRASRSGKNTMRHLDDR